VLYNFSARRNHIGFLLNINQNERRLRELAGAIRSSKNELSLTVKTKNNSDMKEITINTHGDIPNIKSDIIKVLIIAVAILSLQICISLTSF